MSPTLTISGSRFQVFDDFFSERDFATIREWALAQPSELRESVIGKDDGTAWKSSSVVFDETLTGAPMHLCKIISGLRSSEMEWTQTSWEQVSAAVWRYPKGSALGWHNDVGRGRIGEFVCFLHPVWGADWGGELVVIDEPAEHVSLRGDGATTAISDFVQGTNSAGVVVFPKPNRVVVIQAGTAHMIKRVGDSWKDGMRLTLTGFLSEKVAPDTDAARELVRSLTS